jgi:hypothetical protein
VSAIFLLKFCEGKIGSANLSISVDAPSIEASPKSKIQQKCGLQSTIYNFGETELADQYTCYIN